MNQQGIYDFERKLAKLYAQDYTGTETEPFDPFYYLKNIPLIIAKCEEHDVTVWRIECFRFDGKYYMPSLAWIQDMQDKKDEEIWSEYRKLCNEEARDYLYNFREKNDVEPEYDILVTLLLLGKQQWKEIVKRHKMEKKEKESKKIRNRIKSYIENISSLKFGDHQRRRQ